MSEGRHRSRGRAKRPPTGYQLLDRSRRRRIFWRLALGRAIDPADEPFAREKASEASGRVGQAVGQGALFGVFLAAYLPRMFPLTPGTTWIVISAVPAVAIYLFGLNFVIRGRLWLRRH